MIKGKCVTTMCMPLPDVVSQMTGGTLKEYNQHTDPFDGQPDGENMEAHQAPLAVVKKESRMRIRIRLGIGWVSMSLREKKEVVQVPMIVKLALIVIKRGIRALRISVQNRAHPLQPFPEPRSVFQKTA